ncbi:MAG: Muconate cycloisomerase [Armatimonadetes bacterium]|nr:Muconate cycloisomerase [Armatimonadota bacterium]
MKSPFESALRRSTVAENVLVTARLSDGTVGYGEGSPADYVTGETPAGALADVLATAPALRGLDVRRTARWSAALGEALPHSPTASCAIEMALLDALTRTLGVPLWIFLGGGVSEVRTDLTVPITDTDTAGRIATEARGLGYRSLKIKVGGPNRDEDLARVRAVSAGAPGAGIRLDANQGFDAPGALAFLQECERLGIPVEIMEQPVPRDDWDALAEVTRHSLVPVIADEAVVDARAALRVAATGAAHGVNIKLAKAGILGAMQIVTIARTAGLKLMLGCMLESLLGIGGALHVACAAGAFDYLDLDAHALIGITPTGLPFAQDGDILRVSNTVPGIGWTPEIG